MQLGSWGRGLAKPGSIRSAEDHGKAAGCLLHHSTAGLRWLDFSNPSLGHGAVRLTTAAAAAAPSAAEDSDTAELPKTKAKAKPGRKAKAKVEKAVDTADPPVDSTAPVKRKRKSSKAAAVTTAPPDLSLSDIWASLPTLNTPTATPVQPSATRPVAPQLRFEDLLPGVPGPDHPAWRMRKWVVFSDLHVTEKSLSICQKVLDRVIDEAKARSGGVLFLGDFWHQRDSVQFKLLNPVRNTLRRFDREGIPMLMLVGNHDQVDLHGTQHGVECLETDMIHVFTQPTMFRDALFVSYRRDENVVKQAVQVAYDHSNASNSDNLKAIMAHADVATAQFNMQYQAKDGLPVDAFPPNIPVYTGHYHLPHTVGSSSIMYVGSPYQVDKSEAGQQKRLLVLDAERGWAVDEEIPINIGHRYQQQRVAQGTGAHTEGVREGDVVTLKVSKEEAEKEWFKKTKQAYEEAGAIVQVNVEQSLSVQRPRLEEDAAPAELLNKYAETRAPGELSEAGLEAAKAAITAALGKRVTPRRAASHVNLVLQEVQMEGFGPFKDRLTYNLDRRGLRIVTGRNEDDARVAGDYSICSNGSGKSTLVSAPLWALTGELTTRTESGGGKSKGKVGGMKNDDCTYAEVVLRGLVNDKPFIIERVVSGTASKSLKFSVDGDDLTQQDKPMTQKLIDEMLCTSLLRHQVFFGQNDITALLEANDEVFKGWLSHVVEMDIWSAALEDVKPQAKAAREDVSKLTGSLDASAKALTKQQDKVDQATKQRDAWQQQHQHKVAELSQKVEGLAKAAAPAEASVLSACAPLRDAWLRFVELEHKLQNQYDALVKAAPPVPPSPVLPPHPDRVEILAELQRAWQQQALDNPSTTTASDSAQQQLVQMQADEADARALQEQQGKLQEDHKAELMALDQRHALEKTKEEEVEAQLKAIIQSKERNPETKEAVGTEQAVTDAIRDHEAAKQRMREINKNIDRRKRQQSKAGGECETCGQQVDATHVQNHIEELEVEREAALREVQAAGTHLHAARSRQEAAQQVYEQAVAVHKGNQARRYDELSGLRASQQAARARMDQEAAQLQARIQAVKDKARDEKLKREKWEREQLDLACSLRNQAWLEAVARVNQEHKEAVRQATASYQAQQQAERETLDLFRPVHKQMPAWQQAVDNYQRKHQDVLQQPVPEVFGDSEGVGTGAGGVATEGSDAAEVVAAVERAAREVLAVVERAGGVLDAWEEAQRELEHTRSEQNPTERELEWQLKDLSSKESDREEAQAKVQQRTAERDALLEAQKALGREGVQSFVLEGVLKHLEERAGSYLALLSDTLTLRLNAFRPASAAKKAAAAKAAARARSASPAEGEGEEGATPAKKKRAKRAKSSASDSEEAALDTAGMREQIEKKVYSRYPGSEPPGTERDLTQLSGGERRRVALAMTLGFSALIRDKGKLTCNLLVMDEGLQQLDLDGCRRMADILRAEEHDTTLVVAQAQTYVLSQEFSGVDTVVKSRRHARLEEEGVGQPPVRALPESAREAALV